MHKNIKKKLIIRLGFVWIGLSLILGTAVYFLEHKKIDFYIKNLAHEEVNKFVTTDALHLIDNPGNEKILNDIKKYFERSNFTIAKIQGKNKEQIIKLTKTEVYSLENILNKHKHDLLTSNDFQHDSIHSSGKMYVHVSAPLNNNGSLTGYFEGIFKVESGIMSDINSRILFSQIMVITIILIVTVVFYPIVIYLNKNLVKFSIDLSHANIGMLEVLGNAIAKRDSDTNIHNYRVTLYSIKLGESIGLNNDEMRELIKGAFLHDVGKIAISDTILLKSGKLTDPEFEIMKTHVTHGEEIINDYEWLKDAVNIVRYHHEKFNGSGYMQGLKEDDIPVTVRIFSISDVFDALTSKRPYKESLSLEKSLNILSDGRGTHFDPELLDCFMKIAQDLYSSFHDSGEKFLKKTLQDHLLTYFSYEFSL